MPFFLGRAAVCFAVWIAAGVLPRTAGRAQQDAHADHRALDRKLQLLVGRRPRRLRADGRPSPSVDWVMSLEPHWYSTIYGVIFMVGQALGALALAIARRRCACSPLEPVADVPRRPATCHDLGKLMLAFVDALGVRRLLAVPDHLVRQPARGDPLVPRAVPRRLGVGRARPSCSSTSSLPFLLLLSRQANREPAAARRGGGASRRHALRRRRLARRCRPSRPGHVPDPLARPGRCRSASAASGSSVLRAATSPPGRSCPSTTPASRRRSRMDAT